MSMGELTKLKFISTIFGIIAVILLLLNISIKEAKRNLTSISVSSIHVEKEIKIYGYSDILDIVSGYKNIKILNLYTSSENKELVKIEVQYSGSLASLNDALHYFSSRECFHSVEAIRVNNDFENKQIIYATILFFKRK